MEKLTLDTNVLRDWAWADGLGELGRYGNDPQKKAHLRTQFAQLRWLTETGLCELAVTNQIYRDLDKGIPEHLACMVGSYVVISTPGLSTFPLVFPAVFLDKGVRDDILVTAFPDTKPDHMKYGNNVKDALQLYAHKVARRDIFLTNDRRLLDSQAPLFRRHEIRVESLSDYLVVATGAMAKPPN